MVSLGVLLSAALLLASTTIIHVNGLQCHNELKTEHGNLNAQERRELDRMFGGKKNLPRSTMSCSGDKLCGAMAFFGRLREMGEKRGEKWVQITGKGCLDEECPKKGSCVQNHTKVEADNGESNFTGLSFCCCRTDLCNDDQLQTKVLTKAKAVCVEGGVKPQTEGVKGGVKPQTEGGVKGGVKPQTEGGVKGGVKPQTEGGVKGGVKPQTEGGVKAGLEKQCSSAETLSRIQFSSLLSIGIMALGKQFF